MSRVSACSDVAPSAKHVLELMQNDLAELSSPLHILVADQSARRASKGAVCHVSHHRMLPKAFTRIGRDLFASSPELCFVQMAGSLSLIKLIVLGFELCGSYAISPSDPRGFVKRKPLTQVDQLSAFVGKMSDMRGLGRARRAVKYVVDGSASPMETILVMLLCLPVSLGGYGIDVPCLNYRLDTGLAAKRISSKNFYVCDLYWPQASLACEYDSDAFHTGSDRIAGDSKRRNALAFISVSVVTVTRKQVFQSGEMERIARLIAKQTGKRIQRGSFNFCQQRIDLRLELLHFSS